MINCYSDLKWPHLIKCIQFVTQLKPKQGARYVIALREQHILCLFFLDTKHRAKNNFHFLWMAFYVGLTKHGFEHEHTQRYFWRWTLVQLGQLIDSGYYQMQFDNQQQKMIKWQLFRVKDTSEMRKKFWSVVWKKLRDNICFIISNLSAPWNCL